MNQFREAHVQGSSRFCDRVRILALAVFVLVVFSRPLNAQVATGDILGTVADSSGAAIPGARVKVENTGTHEVRKFTTEQDGSYVFTALQPGSYTLGVTYTGFNSFTANNLNLAGGDRARVNATLQVGAVDQHVEVTGQVTALQTDSTNVGSTFTEKAVQELPLNGRNFMALVQTAPGVNPGSPGSLAGGSRINDRRLSSALSANGQYEALNNQLIDGLDNNDRFVGLIELRPSVEAIEQVRTDINLYTAEVGRTAGAAINVITKSGTNSLHGSVFEFFRNDITDARNYFATTNILAHKPILRQNQFGGSLSGPIINDKTFFFTDLEIFKRTDGNNSVYTSSVPTAYEKNHPGDLTDITGGTVVANPDPTALGYFSLYPSPNQPSSTPAGAIPQNNFLYNPALQQTSYSGDAKIDHHFSPVDSMFGRYSYNRTTTLTPAYFPAVNGVVASGVPAAPSPGNSLITTHAAQFNYMHIFSPRLIMEAKAGYIYFYDQGLPLNFGQNLNNSAPFLIPNANGCLDCSGLATITLAGSYGTLGDPGSSPLFLTEQTHQYAASLTWTRGNQTVKAGGALMRRNVSNLQSTFGRGTITFSATSPLLALTNFFKGTPFTYQRQAILEKLYERTWEPSLYVQDDWHATSKLTINAGLRYDVFSAPNEKYGNNANFDLTALQMIVNPSAGVSTSHVNVAPRFGFAYSATPKTVLRGGFGMTFYASDIQQSFLLTNPPYGYASGVVSATTALSAGIAPIIPQSTATAALTGSITSKPRNFKDAYVEQFNLLLQREELGTVFSVGYVGELGRHMLEWVPNLNLPAPAGPSVAGAAPPATPYAVTLPNVTTILYFGDFGSSAYNSFQASAERRPVHGFSGKLNYTHAHQVDDVYNLVDGDAAFGLQPAKISTYDRGNPTIDIANRVAGTFSLELPFGHAGSILYKKVVSGWQLNGLGFWQSGAPVSISSTYTQNARAQINLKTITADRPNYVGGAYLANKGINGFLNPAAFVRQALGTAGNAGRNQFRGPNLRRGDLSLFKTVPVYESLSAQFRIECFNFTNTPNFAQPNSTITGYSAIPDAYGNYEATPGSFGRITSTAYGYSGRQVQFALKLLF